MVKNLFINNVKNGAIKGSSEHKVMASLTIAQAILESGWGESVLTQKANNLFGIKASGWSGASYNMNTGEFDNGKWTTEKDCPFRAYSTWEESIKDHTELLCTKRYEKVREASTYSQACFAVKECGYATDPNYSSLLINIIEQNNLQKFDNNKINLGTSRSDIVYNFQILCNLIGIKDDYEHTLVIDGLLGDRTKYCIKRLAVIKLHSTGASIKFLQKTLNYILNLNLDDDGKFGPLTQTAVENYQSKKGLVEDGEVGFNTWTSLIN